MDELDIRGEKAEQRGHPMEDLISVSIDEDPNKIVWSAQIYVKRIVSTSSLFYGPMLMYLLRWPQICLA